MIICKTIESLYKTLEIPKQYNGTIGFVPTMGALHQGHLSLVQKSQKEKRQPNELKPASVQVSG